jgi:hypothetical protein
VGATAEIDAPIAIVWDVLSDLSRYSEWNPLSPRAQTEALEAGNSIELEVLMPKRKPRVETEWINLVEPGRTICWGMTLLHPVLLVGNRWQELTPLGENRTRYSTVDRFSGLLVPLVIALYGTPMRLGFEATALALKARAEARWASR